MTDTKITGLTELSVAPATSDVFVLVDVSDTSMAATGTDKKIQFTNLGLVQKAGDQLTGRIWRDDFSTGVFDDTAAFVSMRRRIDNPVSENYIINVRGWMTGTATVGDRGVGFQAKMEDGVVANKTITAMTRAGTTVSVSANSHGFSNGTKVAIYGVVHTFNAEVNGAWTVANQATNTFDITVAGMTGGSYTNSGTVTNRPMYYGVASFLYPTLDRGGLTGTALHADDTACFVAGNGGTAKGTDAYYLARNTGIAGSEWTTMFTSDANGDYGIRLNGTLVNSGISLNGTFGTYGLDFNSGTFTGGLIRLKNSSFVVGRNNAGLADVNLFKINTLDELQIDVTTRHNGAVILGDGITVAMGTSTGTKIGTVGGAAGQKMSFWNQTPIVQPVLATGGGATVDNVITVLQNLGLVRQS